MSKDPLDRQAVALERHARLDAALTKGSKSAIRVLWQLRREALREGDVEEGAYWLGYLWSFSLGFPSRHIRLARIRAREAPSAASFLDLGHSLALTGQLRGALEAYARAIELSKISPAEFRELDNVFADHARQAVDLMKEGRLSPFVESIRSQYAPAPVRHQAEYDYWARLAKEAPSALAHQNLGIVCEALNRFEEALASYKAALHLVGTQDESLRVSLDHKVRLLTKDLNQ